MSHPPTNNFPSNQPGHATYALMTPLMIPLMRHLMKLLIPLMMHLMIFLMLFIICPASKVLHAWGSVALGNCSK